MVEFVQRYGTEVKVHRALYWSRWPKDFCCPCQSSCCAERRRSRFCRDRQPYDQCRPCLRRTTAATQRHDPAGGQAASLAVARTGIVLSLLAVHHPSSRSSPRPLSGAQIAPLGLAIWAALAVPLEVVFVVAYFFVRCTTLVSAASPYA